MKEIEEQAIKIIFEETKAKSIEDQLLFDELYYGISVVSVDKDGNQTRIHPMGVIIH